MVDLETGGTEPGCAVLSIGACEFGPNGVGQSYYATALFDSGMKGHFEPSTVKFWLEQHEDARHALTRSKNSWSQRDVLLQFEYWWQHVNGKFLWAHGAIFDEPILRACYRMHDLKEPWAYRAPRDTRTILEAANVTLERLPEGQAHNALEDARLQAEGVIRAYKKLGVWK
jgi:3' exoribonuclease, RNase T-like